MPHARRPPTPDFFGSDAEIDAARAVADDAPGAGRVAAVLAWMLRQRDTHEALAQAQRAERLGETDTGRLALVRAEASWLFNALVDAERHLANAETAFARHGDAVGLGDAALLRATLQDQAGADRIAPIDAAEAHYRRAGAADRLRLAATWRACVDVDETGTTLEAIGSDAPPGLRAYVEAARGTLAWRSGDPAAAITAFQRGFDAALVSGQLQSAVTLAQNVGIAFSTLNDHDGAMAWAERARAIVEPTGWRYHIGWCLMQTGAILVGLGRAAEARGLLEDGLPMFDGAQGSRNHVLACQSLAEACLALDDDGAALSWCEQALQGAEAAPFPDLLSGLQRHRALALSRLGRVHDAVTSAQLALATAEAQGDYQRIPSIHHVLAEIARRHSLPPPKGSPAASGPLHHLQQALTHGARLAGFQPPPEWLHEMSTAQQLAGDAVAALHYEREASAAWRAQQLRRSDELATAMLVRHRTAQALADADRSRAQAEASELRAELLATQAELDKERLQTMLVHAGKLAAIGRLAAGIVHEMSHPVGTVLLLSESLGDALVDAPAPVRDSLGTLLGETRRLQDLVARLRRFARAEPLQIAPHELRAVMADARQLYGPRLRVDRIAVEESVPTVSVQVDPQALALALANLVFNAADAMAGRALPRLWIGGEVAGGRLRLQVGDNGPGLPAAVREHLFEPFFTTRREGLGLGLTLSREAVDAMGGTLAADERPGGGARFTIELPLAPPVKA
ncbi:MAG: hypothetical protein KF788_18115 [Piscinibacter sp.]|nr:hypothetical protein [Piscinibacter sp.]